MTFFLKKSLAFGSNMFSFRPTSSFVAEYRCLNRFRLLYEIFKKNDFGLMGYQQA